jgi:hypothetical protein
MRLAQRQLRAGYGWRNMTCKIGDIPLVCGATAWRETLAKSAITVLETDAMSYRSRLVGKVLAEHDRLAELDIELGGRDAALLALHYRWRTAFFARLDALLEEAPADLDAALNALWTDPAIGGRGLRALLDAHVDHPALAAAQERERCLVHRDLGVELPSRRATTNPPAL